MPLHSWSHPAAFHRPDIIEDPLYVVTPIFNPQRYRTRWKNFLKYKKHVLDSGAHLVLIECAFGNRAFVLPETDHPNLHIVQVRTIQEIWLKEALINRAVVELNRINPDWKYMATVDGDLLFAREDWVGETLQLLQRYPVIQMYSEIINLSPDHEILNSGLSFMEGWKRGIPFKSNGKMVQDETFFKRHHHEPHRHKHHHNPNPPYDSIGTENQQKNGWCGSPGGAWAYTRTAFRQLGGLIDYAILGSADYHMATALFGFLDTSTHGGYHEGYLQQMKEWEKRAIKYINRNVGYMHGSVMHTFHGQSKYRGYGERWKILVKHQFNPLTDLFRDENGLPQLIEEKWQLRDDITSNFLTRNEDDISISNQ